MKYYIPLEFTVTGATIIEAESPEKAIRYLKNHDDYHLIDEEYKPNSYQIFPNEIKEVN